MKPENELLPVRGLFERLSIEVYHGFNMRMILNDLRTKEPAIYRQICNFVNRCKQERHK